MAERAFHPITHDRAFEAIVRQIEGAILDGTYKVGDYLPSERALMEQFAVGRSSVREALRILESLGMLKTSPGTRKGVQVTDSMSNSMSRLLNSAVRVRAIPLVDLIEYRIMTGSTGNFLAARIRTDEHLAEMEATVAEMEASRDDPAAFARADAAFHTAIQNASGNSLMRMVNSVVESTIIDLVHLTVSEANADADALREVFIEKHRELLEAIRERRGREAARIARESLLEVYGTHLSPQERTRLEQFSTPHLDEPR